MHGHSDEKRFLMSLLAYKLVGTDLYAQTRVYRVVGTDLHEQAHVRGGSVSRAIPDFNDYNRKKLIPTIGPKGGPFENLLVLRFHRYSP